MLVAGCSILDKGENTQDIEANVGVLSLGEPDPFKIEN